MKKLLLTITIGLLGVCLFAQLPDTVNTGTGANTGTGDNLRTAFYKLNANDKYLYSLYDTIKHSVQIEVTTETLVSSADSVYVLTIPEALAGMNLIKLEAYPGSVTGNRTMSVVAYRNRSGTVTTMTSSGASFSVNATINTSYDDVQRGDKIAIGWTFTGGTTDPVGLIVQLTFQKP